MIPHAEYLPSKKMYSSSDIHRTHFCFFDYHGQYALFVDDSLNKVYN